MSDVNEIDNNEEDLDEAKKASLGDPSLIPDPVGGQTPKRKADKRTGDSTLPEKDMGSKWKMLAIAMSSLKKMTKEDLADVVDALTINEDDFEDDVSEETELPEIEVDGEIEDIFGSEELSEEFKKKVHTVFEAAVAQKVHTEVEAFVVEAAAEVEAEKETLAEEMVATLDTYLDYVTEQWFEANELAVEKGIRDEMMESCMGTLKTWFENHYIDIPEEKTDVVEELIAKNAELQNELSVAMDEIIEHRSELLAAEKDMVLSAANEGLSEADADKLAIFAEAVEYIDMEDFVEKVDMLKTHYFTEDTGSTTSNSKILNEEDEPFTEEEDPNAGKSPQMKAYVEKMSALNSVK